MRISGIPILLLVSSGIFINYKMNHLLNQSGSLLLGKDRDTFTNSQTTVPAAPQDESGIAKENVKLPSKSGAKSAANHSNPQLESISSSKGIKVSDIEKRIGQPIEKQDILKAGLILMRKFSAEDIRYLKKVAMQDSCSREEYQRSQEIILNRLSVEDINTLKKLGENTGVK